ncbi:hypothetical protein ACFLIM_05215 [Nonomuraea sp. M3C6]|uniref:Ig-like domain-containing protein n=1 Tax=Nonomuraea marmarensis TaxID=3351344 RepID=A0ABW7A5G2_9ACTN
MFKRRVAIVTAVAALGLAGMAGSALADEGPVRVHGGSELVLQGGRLTCWLSDGEVVKFSKAKVTELIEGDFVEPTLEWSVTEDGVTTVPADRLSISVPAKKLPGKAGKRWKHRRLIHLTCVVDEPVYKDSVYKDRALYK